MFMMLVRNTAFADCLTTPPELQVTVRGIQVQKPSQPGTPFRRMTKRKPHNQMAAATQKAAKIGMPD
jgi:hypothetical protein